MACQTVSVQQDLLLAQLAFVVGRDNVVVSGSVFPLVGRNIHVVFLPSVSPQHCHSHNLIALITFNLMANISFNI